MDSSNNFLKNLIDYAGLFPPASLSLRDAIENYASYKSSNDAWMLGRFILPASKIEELSRTISDISFTETWFISALVGDNLESELEAIDEFNEKNKDIVIDTIETKLTDKEMRLPSHLTCFIEVPLTVEFNKLTWIEENNYRAKIRTGGVTADMIPAGKDLVSLLKQFATSGVGFKATAGLHHATTSTYPLTYEKDSPRAQMHGFLNLFLSAAFIYHGMSEADAFDVLRETSLNAFEFYDGGVSWGAHNLTSEEILKVRQNFAYSFGSCSFEEPVDDLRKLGLL
jgi:hypothetical protein